MNILRVADENNIPWFAPMENEKEFKPSVSSEKIEDLNTSLEVDDSVLAQECDKIDVCSTNGKVYHYNVQWDNEVVSHLKEYAIACGMDLGRFRGCEPSVPDDVRMSKKTTDSMVKTAQTVQKNESPKLSQSDVLKALWEDPFHIEARADTSHMEASNWEQIKKEEKLGDPNIDSGDVVAIRGGENYFENSDVNLASNQNSITNPYAIEELARGDEPDNGERLKQQNLDKEAQKQKDHQEWERNKIAAMVGNDIIPMGNVFPTESLNAQSGLNTPSSSRGVYADFDPDDIPEKTTGERLGEKNAELKSAIQRPQQHDEWEKPQQQNTRTISNTFADSLAENLNKTKK